MTTLEITGVSIVHGAMDHCQLHTNLPAASYPFQGTASLTLQVAHGQGVEYIRKHFGNIDIRVVDSY